MDNTLCIYINMIFIVVTLIMLPGAVKMDRRQGKGFLLTAFYITLIAWELMDIAIFIVKDALVIRYLYDMVFTPMGIAILLFFLLVARFFRIEQSIPKTVKLLIFIVPLISGILALTTMNHGLYRTYFEVTALSPLLNVENERGIWYYIQIIYYSIFTAATLALAIKNYRKLPSAYRRGPFWLLVLVALVVLGVVLSFVNVWVPELDLFLFCICASSVIFYLVNIINERLDYMSFERKEIFNYLPEQIFILNTDGVIMDANVRAKKTLTTYNIDGENLLLSKLLEQLEAIGQIIIKPALDGVGTDIYVPTHSYHDVYNMRSYDIKDKDGSVLGHTVIISDVSKNRLTIERYNELAGVDPLTGLYNRYFYQKLLGELDTPQNLPLSIIMGDLNGLKRANDTSGHEYGDRLLREVASALAECCPQDGYTARIGGDEFVVLLPGRDGEYAKRLIEELRRAIAGRPLLSGSSVAFGCATKTSPEMNVNRLFDDADLNMYKDKG